MVFINSTNSSNNDFENTSGTFQFANRVRLIGGHCENIGIAYSAGTFTVQGADGVALSATNPAYVILQSKATPGNLVKYTITANQTFTDGASGTTATQRFGLTAGINASVDIPFYLYAVGDDTEAVIAFMIGRVPQYGDSPVSTKIGVSGAVVNVSQSDLFSLANITTTSYDTNPCLVIGSFRMRFVGATNSWTVQALNTFDGIGNFQENISFIFPVGQFGAASGKAFADNGGTAPADTSMGYGYRIEKNGYCQTQIVFPSATTAGVGAVDLVWVLPIATRGGVSAYGFTGASSLNSIIVARAQANDSYLCDAISRVSSGSDTSAMTNAAIQIGNSFDLQGYYPISLT